MNDKLIHPRMCMKSALFYSNKKFIQPLPQEPHASTRSVSKVPEDYSEDSLFAGAERFCTSTLSQSSDPAEESSET
tara:strand:- start:127 stop:354 length:228 start_codon:yes stop_codon:yes gene_type:complete